MTNNLENADVELNPLRAPSLPPKPDHLKKPANNADNHTVQTKPPPTFSQNVSYYFSEYCGATSAHGIQYIGERGRYIIEKFIWTVIIMLVWAGCLFLITRTYNKWVTSPVIVSFSTTETPISNIPFPAVTICPEVKCSSDEFNITEVLLRIHNEGLDKLSTKEQNLMKTLFLICEGEIMQQFGLNVFFNKPFGTDSDVIEDLWELSQPIFNPSSWQVSWLGKNLEPQDSYLVLTEHGFCYTFNNLYAADILKDVKNPRSMKSETKKVKGWSFENSYTNSSAMDVYPRRTFTSGLSGGLRFELISIQSNIEYICSSSLQGFKVVLHHPSELPTMNKFFQLPLDTASNVAIIPKMITVADALKHYLPSNRKCYYTHEKPLRYFKSYTQNNCIFECISNYTLENCGCAAFYMPRSSDTTICGIIDKDCVDQSKIDYSHVISKLSKSGSQNEGGCDCLPTCTSLEYDVEISQSKWNWRSIKTAMKYVLNNSDEDLDFDLIHISLLNVYFKESQFLSTERNELYGLVDFFSNTGGLLGLFIGFSVTSVIEIIYFLTLRLVCNIKKYGKQYWAGETIIEASKEE